MIDVRAKSIIQADIIEVIKKSHILSISVDEVTSSNNEILSVCVLYVNKNFGIKEIFLEVLEM